MTIRAFEKLLLVIVVSFVSVYFLFNLSQNPTLLDWSVPVMVGVLFVSWLIFRHPQKQP